MYMKAVIEMRKQLYVYESSYRNVNLDIYIWKQLNRYESDYSNM